MFSVIIPLFNKKKYINRAIQSIVNQSFKKFEIIVVNDGSKDGGEKEISLENKIDFKLINQNNQGVSAARNIGIDNAKYPYIAFLDADDYWDPNYLQIANKAIENNFFPGFIGAKYLRFNDFKEIKKKSSSIFPNDFEVLGIKEFFVKYLEGDLCFTSSIIIKADFFQKNNGFDPDLKSGEDLDVWFRALLFYEKAVLINIPLVYYSKEDDNSATKKIFYLPQTIYNKIFDDQFYPIFKIKSKVDQLAFSDFRLKLIYLRLWQYYLNKENQIPIENLIKKMPKKYFLVGIFYRLPFSVFYFLITKKRFRRYFRNHLTRCFNSIYKDKF